MTSSDDREPGGEEYDEVKYRQAQIRADLAEIATKIDYRYGAKIVDAILARYEVKRK